MCQKNLPFYLMILKVSINLKNMENLNKVLAQCLKFWATHEWQKRSPHSLSQWVQINETSVLEHMCFSFPNPLSPTLSELILNIICTKKSCAGDNFSLYKHSTGGTQCNFISRRFTEVNLLTCQCLHMYHLYTGMHGMQYLHSVLWQRHQCT